MKIKFKCHFLTDIILNPSSSTQQSTECLDYVPGAKFLGIVANKVFLDKNTSNEVIKKLFFDGTARFGDAHLAVGQTRTLKLPFALFEEKGNKEAPVRVHYLYSEAEHRAFRDQSIQLKQLRSGYFIQDGQQLGVTETSKQFSIKSAYDTQRRRPKDEMMYGYAALEKGTVWYFAVELDDERLKSYVVDHLVGEHSLGKSRSAEYGRVRIETVADYQEQHQSLERSDYTVLYFASNACFYDENGQPTARPSNEQLKLDKDAKILWNLSQIRTRMYAPWNQHRKARDTDRFIIEKGSVIVLEKGAKVDGGKTHYFCDSAFKAEGFGEILVNPVFLSEREWRLSRRNKDQELIHPPKKEPIIWLSEEAKAAAASKRTALMAYFKHRTALAQEQKSDQYKEVKKFLRSFENQVDIKEQFNSISASQWGQVRTIASHSLDARTINSLLFDSTYGYLVTGKSAQNWTKVYPLLREACNKIAAFSEVRKFLMALADYQAKELKKIKKSAKQQA
jgi:hypothetical protein